jgi:hypothetical protein
LEDLCSSLLGHLQTLLYFPIVLDFRTFFSVDIITLFTLVVQRHLGGVFFFHYSILPFVTKMGVIVDLDRDCIFNRSSDFCPRMAKGGVC